MLCNEETKKNTSYEIYLNAASQLRHCITIMYSSIKNVYSLWDLLKNTFNNVVFKEIVQQKYFQT